METIYDFSKKINQLTTAKQYNEALTYFKEHKLTFDQSQIVGNIFLVSDIITCLRHIKAYSAAYKFMELYAISIDETTPEKLLTAYAWLLYDNFKADNGNTDNHDENHLNEFKEAEIQHHALPEHKSDLIKRIQQAVVLLQNGESNYRSTALELLFKIVLKAEINGARPDWYFVKHFCQSVAVHKLTTTSKTIQVTRKGETKDMELASMQEEWYAHYSKALYQTAGYEQCVEMCKQALENVKVFHYSNDCWLARRMALCLKKMGDTAQAIVSLEKLLKRRRDWFILKELSELYLDVAQADKALGYAKEAMNGYGPLAFKVELIEMLGDMLMKNGDNTLAYKHYTLAKLVREQEKWQVDKQLQEKIKSLASEQNNCVADKKTIENELKLCWNISAINSKRAMSGNETTATAQKRKGTIAKLLPEKETGVDGFVKHDNGGTAYFFVPKNNPLFNELKIGMALEYETAPAQNGKGDKAVKLKKI
jgi:tetratricopeptide (TPR) repeat protein